MTLPEPHPAPQASLRAAGLRVCILVAVVCALQVGCVQRRLTIKSNPPGALVYVDDFQVGTTPCSTEFVYYGTRKVRLVLSGYETMTVLQPIPAPWYQWYGIDFISENLVPGEIRDERVVEYQLRPQMIKPSQQLLAGAENLRHSMPAPQSQVPQFPPGFAPPSYGNAPQPSPGLPASPPPVSRPGGLFSN